MTRSLELGGVPQDYQSASVWGPMKRVCCGACLVKTDSQWLPDPHH